MKFAKIIDTLKDINFVKDTTKILVGVTKRRTYNITEILFKCMLPVEEAKRFFGELNVTLNTIANEDERPIAYFLLNEEGIEK